MAVNGFILDQYLNKNIEVILRNNEGTIYGVLTKVGKSYFVDKKKLTISKISTLKEVGE